MAFDNSRVTFDPFKDYSAVVMEQGRVQTDADWNEYLAELSRRTRAGTLDTFGHAVYPQTTPNGFKIDVDSKSNVRIGLGRMYVDGILVENHGDESKTTWDPALAEPSNTPQPQPTTPQPLDNTNSILFENQPYGFGATAPSSPGAYVAYLDVWERPITFIEDSSLIDIAIGVDTTGRLQTAWRVGFLPLPALAVAGKITSTSGSFKPGDPITQAGSPATAVIIGNVPSNGPMIIGQLSGAPTATGVWSNSSGAQFTPTALPTETLTYIDGSVTSTSVTFQANETVVQSGTGASAVVAGTVPTGGPMIVGGVSGTPAALAPWTGMKSGAVFTPVALPSISSSSIAGNVTSSGSFIPNEQVVQTSSSSTASANLIGSVPASGPMIVGVITGTPDSSDTWIGQQSKAVFTPKALPTSSTWSCPSSDYSLPWPASSGTLTTQPASAPKTGPCCLTTGSGYTGPENQFYRIEIHTPGGAGGAGATFKWSRENASVQTVVTAIGSASNTLGDPANSLTVQSLGRDQVLGFSAGDWIEITDQAHDDYCLPGEIYKIDRVDVPSSSIILTTQLSANFSSTTLGKNAYTRIIRWDQSGQVYNIESGKQQAYYNLDTVQSGATLPNGCGGIPIPTDGSPVVLENGIAISFGLSVTTGSFQAMNFWNFTARTADGSIEQLDNAPPRGIAHHYTKLSIVTIPATGTGGATDCRNPWPPTTASEECGCCCSVTVGDNLNSFGKFTSIQKAIDSLTGGGEVCILAGDFYENIFIEEKYDLVIHGCGEQTRIYSESLGPGSPAITGGFTAIDVPAVFSLAKCFNVSMDSFVVIADDGQVGILMDRLPASGSPNKFVHVDVISNRTVSISDIQVGASTLPAIAARGVSGLKIGDNQIVMLSTASLFPAVYLSGENIWFERNQVTIESDLYRKSNLSEAEAQSGVLSGFNNFASPAIQRALAVGGVQVGGPSLNVWIVENQISGGSRNGITLGNLIYLDADGNDDGTFVGAMLEYEDMCSQGGSGSIPGGGGSSGSPSMPVAAGGAIRNLHILRNTIRDTGMSGIGPVGFFDLNTRSEIVSLTNVLIAENLLVNTLSRRLTPAAAKVSTFGYGVISLPDVQNLIIRDNIINNYGVAPGAEVCGIYVYYGEGVEIDRNQVRESRDLSLSEGPTWGDYGNHRAGIYIEHALPPTLDTSANSAWFKSVESYGKMQMIGDFKASAPDYAPGVPALRITNNVVRVAYGLALYVLGKGPFSILGNHFSSGGVVSSNSEGMANFDFSNPSMGDVGTFAAALTVAIVNLGVAIEAYDLIEGYLSLINAGAAETKLIGNALAVTNGTVMFSNNTVQLMAQLNNVRGLCSVAIVSLDHVLFNGNEIWINGGLITTLFDAFLMGITMQANSNRFQESFFSVFYSGFTFGLSNITAHNTATFCLLPVGIHAWLIKSPNIILVPDLCKDQALGQ